MPRGYRLLCTADLHVGRRPSRLGGLLDPARCSCAAMFERIVRCAIEQRVDAVAISGDLVDQSNKYHEALGALERGLLHLSQAGIDVVAIAGNHDFDVLPRLAAAIEHTGGAGRFHLLGRGGAWQCKLLGTPQHHRPLRVIGFSFPTERVIENPLRTLRTTDLDGFATCTDGPVLGLLHADLDQPDSIYAPVMRRDLCAAPGTCASLWLLGHIHKPNWMPSDGISPALLYPGSPAAMDPGETGIHGPWLIEINPTGHVTARQIPLSPVRYDLLEIDLTGTTTPDAFDAALQKQVRAHVSAACEACAAAGAAAAMELACLRVRLIGATPLHRELRRLANLAIEQFDLPLGHCRVRLDDITIDTRPPVDLRQLATGRSIAAELARLLLDLQSNAACAAIDPLLAQASAAAEELCLARAYQPICGDNLIASDPSDSVAMRTAMLRQGTLLLDALLAQKQPQTSDLLDPASDLAAAPHPSADGRPRRPDG